METLLFSFVFIISKTKLISDKYIWSSQNSHLSWKSKTYKIQYQGINYGRPRKPYCKDKVNNFCWRFIDDSSNKKVLLCERNRHTARRVSSTPSAVLTWAVPPSGPGWGTPIWTWLRYPSQEGTWDQSLGYSPKNTWDQLKYYGMEMGYPPPGVNWQTNWKYHLPHFLDAGNYYVELAMNVRGNKTDDIDRLFLNFNS